jgi:SAM-dependent methyltransferase
MQDSEHRLREYYEEEARLRLRVPVTGRRVELRDQFLALLQSEGRKSVVDFGSGPGRDGEVFVAAGLHYVGLDLAHSNGVLAAERGVHVVQGSISTPPFRPHSFDAGWSMSTLMHLPEDEAALAVLAMTQSLCVGAPLFIGLWGGDKGDFVSEFGIDGQSRLFCLRHFDVNLGIVAAHAEVTSAEAWETVDGWQYQVFQLRIR